MGLGITGNEGLTEYAKDDMSSVLTLCTVLYRIIQNLRKSNNDLEFLKYFFSRK